MDSIPFHFLKEILQALGKVEISCGIRSISPFIQPLTASHSKYLYETFVSILCYLLIGFDYWKIGRIR